MDKLFSYPSVNADRDTYWRPAYEEWNKSKEEKINDSGILAKISNSLMKMNPFGAKNNDVRGKIDGSNIIYKIKYEKLQIDGKDDDSYLQENLKLIKVTDEKNCPGLKKEKKLLTERQDVISSTIINKIKNEIKNTSFLNKIFIENKKDIDSMSFQDLSKVGDYCTCQNYSKRNKNEIKCPDSLMEPLKSFYDFKFYGYYNQRQQRIKSNHLAKKIVYKLENFLTHPQTQSQKLPEK